MITHEDKTIIAQCTPKGTGAIALIRLSGSQAITIADKMSELPKGKKLIDLATHTINYGSVLDSDGNKLDKSMFIVMKAPGTFTGENIIEITCHNNPFIIEQIILCAIRNGARLAQEGEFAKRAFLNGKIDLPQAEAINELITANTGKALKKSLSQLSGSFSNWIMQIEKNLTKCLVLSEASFEFLDDEVEFGPQIISEIDNLINQIKEVKQKFSHQKQIKEGIRIALIGSVNAGKSSLFNALIKENRAIVTNIAGTTRDSIEMGVYKNDYYMTLIDTAGLRSTHDTIELEGIKRSFEEAHKADIILLVFDGSRQISPEEKEVYLKIGDQYPEKVIFVINKSDLDNNFHILSLSKDKPLNELHKVAIQVSTQTKQNLDTLEIKIKEKIDLLLSKGDSPFLINKRQFILLEDLENKLSGIKDILGKNIAYEILSIHINEAMQSIMELTGKSISEIGMDAIFREFCVGK